MTFDVYSDGSTRRNGKAGAIGAWAYVILNDSGKMHQDCQVEVDTTNQRMELMAAAEALEYLFNNGIAKPFDKVIVYTDSAYLYNCYTDKWYVRWQANNWRNTKRQEVANKELWQRLIGFFEMPEVEIVKVKGHADNRWNCYVDDLAQSASARFSEARAKEMAEVAALCEL